ncbi:MAG: exodeoxyribonuclease VII small subunit [Spirochaetes bacterium]|nr:exodeoxyribonuclease VII small subunit [Spirochaetota bacterium]NLJ04779.1 exodeoxyribonuclease VII small subunit [Exilispira sp.]MBP8990981.1 exodeoxyribonuclease VII small subunit [Spirochaetota bacterium]HOV46461.1 exodeoxyribonuclease VII small subunit [Exilispira sp.]HPO60293.1 exodeoxyribonuclease VII small subunit [Exilispira sp.]
MNQSKYELRSFEENLKALEQIVSEMEKPDIELDKAIELYKEGLNLSIYLNNFINNYEGKIRILEKNFEDGKFTEFDYSQDQIKNSEPVDYTTEKREDSTLISNINSQNTQKNETIDEEKKIKRNRVRKEKKIDSSDNLLKSEFENTNNDEDKDDGLPF